MDDNKWAVIGAGLVGVAVGVTLGLLFAPAPGKETRQMLKEKVCQAGEHTDELVRKVTHHGQGDAANKDAV